MEKPADHNEFSKKFEGFEFSPSEDLWDRMVDKASPVPGEYGEKMIGLSMEPGAHVWDRIEAVLHEEKKRRAFVWWWVAAGLILLLGGRGIQFVQSGSSVERAETALNEIIKGNDVLVVEKPDVQKDLRVSHDERFEESDHQFVDESDSRSKDLKDEVLPKKNKVEPRRKEQSTPVINPFTSRPSIALNSGVSLSKVEQLRPSLLEIGQAHAFNDLSEFDNPVPFPKESQFGFERLGVEYTPGLLAANTKGAASGDQLESFTTNTTTSPSPVADAGGQSETFQLPLTLGADAHFRVGKRTGVFGGLQYTLLRSTYWRNDGAGGPTISGKIARNYIGIPIGVRYALVQRKKWTVSGKTSILSELGLNENRTRTETYSNFVVDLPTEKRSILKPQFSWGLGVEVNYQLLKNWGLYGEVGTSTFLYQSHYNVWSSQRIWPRVKIGLNYNF